jgi:hypothetical protein
MPHFSYPPAELHAIHRPHRHTIGCFVLGRLLLLWRLLLGWLLVRRLLLL